MVQPEHSWKIVSSLLEGVLVLVALIFIMYVEIRGY